MKIRLYMLGFIAVGLIISPLDICAEDSIISPLSLNEDAVNKAEQPTTMPPSPTHAQLGWLKAFLLLHIIIKINRSISSIIHECGHGFTAYALGQKVIQWNLKPIFYLKGNPSVDFTLSKNVIKNILIIAAGPIAGIIGGLVVSKASAALCRYFLTKNKTDASVTKAYSELIENYSSSWNIFSQIINFIPARTSKITLDGWYLHVFLKELSPILATTYSYSALISLIASLVYNVYNTHKYGKAFYKTTTQSTISEE